MSLHAHVTTRSRDCDGEYRRGRIDWPTIEERVSHFPELEFKDRVFCSVVNLNALDGYLQVTPEGVEYSETTEEGFTSSVIEWCEDDCADGSPWQRDLSAERAGY